MSNMDELATSKGFWNHAIDNPSIFEEKIALLHSEATEILEARRDKNEVLEAEECADLLIRVFDYMAARFFSPEAEVKAKMEKNKVRPYLHGRAR